MSDTIDHDRGIHYSDGGVWAPVYYPDPKLIESIHEEWRAKEGKRNEHHGE